MQQSDTQLIPLEAIEHRIHVVRGLKVMLDKDLAELYQVPTKRLNEQVKRNVDRFPLDFMFQLSEEEAAALRSHSATSKTGRAVGAIYHTRSQSMAHSCWPAYLRAPSQWM